LQEIGVGAMRLGFKEMDHGGSKGEWFPAEAAQRVNAGSQRRGNRDLPDRTKGNGAHNSLLQENRRKVTRFLEVPADGWF